MLGMRQGIDPNDLTQAGWAIIFSADMDLKRRSAIEDALKPLLELRQAQTGELFHVFSDGQGYQPNDSKSSFLRRHGVSRGLVDPFTMPYYLLLVGDPEEIPFRFQYELSTQYAVGRLDFEDDLDAYANYAHNVVAAEKGASAQPPRAVVFATEHQDDQPTYLSANALVRPLIATLMQKQKDWEVDTVVGEVASKEHLLQLLGGQDTPTLLLTATHGLAFPAGHSRQVFHQGALLCQDWPGPHQWSGSIRQEFYVAGDDVPTDAHLQGMIAFCYAAYSAGTPKLDQSTSESLKSQSQIAPHAFTARLPQRLLGIPNGALAVVGQVDQTFAYAYAWEGLDIQLTVFERGFGRLMEGGRVGWAMAVFGERYVELSSSLVTKLDDIRFKQTDPKTLVGMWAASRDARSLVILGDPAVRLPVMDSSAST